MNIRVVHLSRHGQCYRVFFWDGKLTAVEIAEGRERWKTITPFANSSICARAIDLFREGKSREYAP
jgi:outer membrane protein assembly factor BamB